MQVVTMEPGELMVVPSHGEGGPELGACLFRAPGGLLEVNCATEYASSEVNHVTIHGEPKLFGHPNYLDTYSHHIRNKVINITKQRDEHVTTPVKPLQPAASYSAWG